jgi:ubiquinone/menaquinone biosynthesis C-methylase UbiE
MEKLEKILSKVGDLSFRRRILTLLRYLNIKSSDKILDAGCGEGFYVMLLNELYGCQVVGLDNDPEILNRARKWVGEKEGVEFIIGDVTKLPFENESFDKIILSEVLEHVPDDKMALSEIHRVLKNNGVLVVTVPNHDYPFLWDPLNWLREHLGLGHFHPDSGFFGGIWAMHLRLYFPSEIKKLVEGAGFKVEKIEGLTHYCLPFNHNILYLGKRFYTRLPVPESLSSSMEKFEWKKGPPESKFNLIGWGLKVMKAVDSLNETRWDGHGSSLHIAIKAVKFK